jgi:hypothetical protein
VLKPGFHYASAAPEDVRPANPARPAPTPARQMPSRDRLDVHLSRLPPAQMRIDPVVRLASRLKSGANVAAGALVDLEASAVRVLGQGQGALLTYDQSGRHSRRPPRRSLLAAMSRPPGSALAGADAHLRAAWS